MQKMYHLALLALLVLCSLELAASSQEEVALTAYVHEGDINGTLLSGVQITGTDTAGNEFADVTDSNGAAIIYGQPGTWQFSFTKDGYEPLDLSYDVEGTDAGAVYLVKA